MSAQVEHPVAVMPRPERTAEALRSALAALAPSWIPEFDRSQDEATDKAVELGALWPVHAWLRHWAAIVEIERHPDTSYRYRHAEQIDTLSDDPEVRRRAVRVSGDIYRAALDTVGE
ncbi:hypothetical protein LO772_29495 [Yinghuangia sp. ASG 101]|uniref:DUF6247 family protein n=1 Tax=Yinghuangia sp. ASG 101 TaxID=2896848 RepID=UPI001E370EB0|nr:DUF6247 family protein [Yinghuangia sp. ASG 101]UGQ10906.1 hypothetical protein LO772_29495 [Yinghuangia sp. ASG 101]